MVLAIGRRGPTSVPRVHWRKHWEISGEWCGNRTRTLLSWWLNLRRSPGLVKLVCFSAHTKVARAKGCSKESLFCLSKCVFLHVREWSGRQEVMGGVFVADQMRQVLAWEGGRGGDLWTNWGAVAGSRGICLTHHPNPTHQTCKWIYQLVT